jgi:hypothetical protein
MLDVHQVLRVDPLTYTIFGQPSVNQQWAAGVIFASIYGIAGWRGLLLLRAILVATAFGGTLASWSLFALKPPSSCLEHYPCGRNCSQCHCSWPLFGC